MPLPDAVPREETKVTVDGVVETWRLEWRHPPVPTCMGDDWYTCPCSGFELGEKGDLDLVRERAGAPEERLGLDPFFENGDAILPRWAPTDKERKDLKVPTQAELQKRPLVKVMNLGDYDHDGRATEMVLQIGAGPCGHREAAVVGIDRKNPKLHVFASVEAPKDLLLLRPSEWEKAKAKLPQDFVELACGDHGSDEEDTLSLSVDAAGLHAKASRKPCP